MLEYKHEVQHVCSNCSYRGNNFKLYEEILEIEDDVFECVAEVVTCPECGHGETV